MKSLKKLVLLSALAGTALVGCTSNSILPNNVKQHHVAIHAVTAAGVGEKIGVITLSDSAQGLLIQTQLNHLPAGPHGFHIHENPSCEPALKDGKMGAALAAGGHFNPHSAPNHGTPSTGHLGDLPLLNVAANGTAKVSLIAPRLTLADIEGRAIMIHAGGDNYSDNPKPLGGGGDRIACGLIQ